MAILRNKIDFVAFVSVTGANPNGDPLLGNRPRTDPRGCGEISDVCIKRKLRSRMQDLGHETFLSDGSSPKERAKALARIKNPDEFAQLACRRWLDVRSFGQVFAFDKKDFACPSVGVRGAVCVQQAVSLAPVEVVSMRISSGGDLGVKHFVRFGLYEIKGSVNARLAEKTGFTEEDAQVVKECLRTLFVNDSSAARPDGSMEVVRLFWFEHSCRDGQYSSAKVHRSVRAVPAEGVSVPQCAEDYVFVYDELAGLVPEVIEGL